MTDAQPEAGTASEGAFSVDDAVANIIARKDQSASDDAAQDTVEETETKSDAAPTAEDSEADLVEEATAAEEESDDTEAESPPIQPPHSWDKEAKERFASLDRDTQEYLVSRENERDKAVSQKLNEAAEVRKAAEAQASQTAQYAQVFDQLAAQAQQTFADRWAGVDWNQAAQQLEPREYQKARAQFERDQQVLQQTQQAQQVAEGEAHAAFMQREEAKLTEIAPELVNKPENAEARTKLGKFLTERGVEPEALKWASAEELSLAYDAMRYREMTAQPRATNTPETKPAPKAVKPGAEAKTKPKSARTAEAATRRAAQTGSVDDAVDAIMAKRRARRK